MAQQYNNIGSTSRVLWDTGGPYNYIACESISYNCKFCAGIGYPL